MLRWKLMAILAAAVVVLPLLLLALLSIFSRRPDNLGVHNGRLAECPDLPNCVSSQEVDADHRVEPFAIPGETAQETFRRLREIVAAEPNARVVAQSPEYLHAEFTSRIFRFVDDLELLADEQAGVVHVRSASRAGRSDFGVNRSRVEKIRRRLRP